MQLVVHVVLKLDHILHLKILSTLLRAWLMIRLPLQSLLHLERAFDLVIQHVHLLNVILLVHAITHLIVMLNRLLPRTDKLANGLTKKNLLGRVPSVLALV